jgi:cytochrome c oxidase subunit 2
MKMHKKLFYLLTTIALVLALSACGDNNKDNNAGASAPTSEQTASQEVVIKAKSWEFDQAEYKIPKDTPVKLTLELLDGAHGIKINGTDTTLRGNKSTVVTLAAGTYDIECNIMCGTGHTKMKAKLIVS